MPGQHVRMKDSLASSSRALLVDVLTSDELYVFLSFLSLEDLTQAAKVNNAFNTSAMLYIRKVIRPLLALFSVSFGVAPKKVLRLKRIKIQNINGEDVQVLASAGSAGMLANLKTIDIFGNRIGGRDMLSLSNAVHCCDKLRNLFLHHNNITCEGMRILSESVARGAMRMLLHLNLRCNFIGNDGLRAFASALQRSKLPSLLKLDVGTNRIGDVGLNALTSSATSMPSLRAMWVDQNDITGEGICELLRIGGPVWNLRSVAFADAQIGDVHMHALATTMKAIPPRVLTNLEYLNLMGTGVGDNGIIELALALSTLPSLKILGLENNHIANAGVFQLSAVSVSGRTLRSLQILLLGWNEIEDAGLTSLLVASRYGGFPSLMMLGVDGNRIGDTGVDLLISSIQKGALSAVECLDIADNHIMGYGMQLLAESIWRGVFASLKELHVENNWTSSDAVREACDEKGIAYVRSENG